MGNAASDLSRINTIIFDMDGTLIDTNELIYDSWRYTVETLTGRSVTDEVIRGTLGEILLDSMKRLMPEIDPEKALDVYRTYQREIFLDRIELYDGVETVLRKLHEAGYKMAILTSRLTSSTGRALAHFKIESYFEAVLTASDTEFFKPAPEPVYQILDMVGSKPEEALLIGDTVHDIEAGLAAGVFTVLVGWSVALPPEQRGGVSKPDAVIEKMPDLLCLLKGE